MKQKYCLTLAIIILALIVFISGCTKQNGSSETRSVIDTKLPPALSLYGKLLDYSVKDDVIDLKIQTESVNYNLNNTQLEIAVNKTSFKEFHKEIEDYTQKNFEYSEENVQTIEWYSNTKYFIYNISELEPKTYYYFKFVGSEYDPDIINNFFGQFLAYNETEDTISIFHIGNDVEGIVNLAINYYKFMYAQRPWRINALMRGNLYVFYFTKWSEHDDPWDRLDISENISEYEQNGFAVHAEDLVINQMTTTESYGDDPNLASRIIPTAIAAGEPTELKILLINKQNNDISYRIKDAKIVNEEASQFYGSWWQLPPYEERLSNAIINACAVSFDSSEYTIPAGSNKTISFIVNCPEDINITKNYEICDNYEERRNCRIETTRRNDLMLWGAIEFVDVLDNVHVFPEKGILKQFLEIK